MVVAARVFVAIVAGCDARRFLSAPMIDHNKLALRRTTATHPSHPTDQPTFTAPLLYCRLPYRRLPARHPNSQHPAPSSCYSYIDFDKRRRSLALSAILLPPGAGYADLIQRLLACSRLDLGYKNCYHMMFHVSTVVQQQLDTFSCSSSSSSKLRLSAGVFMPLSRRRPFVDLIASHGLG